ncbi:MAG: porin family protein [Bacteroidota bacterium]
MRKNVFLILFVFGSLSSFAQVKLGFQFSPTLSSNRIDADSDTLSLDTDGTGVRFAAGPIVDIGFTDNYFVSTGLLFVSKRAGLEANALNDANPAFTEEYRLQYLQIPLSLKLLTNEVAIDKKIYFQFGTTLEFAVQDEPDDSDNFIIEDFKLFDSSLLVGVGLEYKIGVSTILFGGFSYHRGLLNAVSDQVRLDDDISFKNDYIGLDLGIKF